MKQPLNSLTDFDDLGAVGKISVKKWGSFVGPSNIIY